MDIAVLNVHSAQHCISEGIEELQCKNFFTIGTTDDLKLDQEYGIVTKTIN